MFVQILRAYLAESESFPAGWLRALSDRRLAPALQLMHGDPGRSWQLEELAKAAAMSRTTFALHSVLARSLGYTSESAFSNAFKRVTGNAPKRYRSAAKVDDSAGTRGDSNGAQPSAAR